MDIQRVTRGFLVRSKVKDQHNAAMIIQAAWWGKMERREMERAATVIQSRWRGVCDQQTFHRALLQRDSAIAIQRIWRGYIESLLFSITVESAIMIQKATRGFLAKRSVSVRKCRSAAISIQRVWRGFWCQVQYQIDLLDIISIQSLARRRIAMKERTQRLHSILVLQGAVRSALARRALNSKLEEFEIKCKRYHSAIVCQVRMQRSGAFVI